MKLKYNAKHVKKQKNNKNNNKRDRTMNKIFKKNLHCMRDIKACGKLFAPISAGHPRQGRALHPSHPQALAPKMGYELSGRYHATGVFARRRSAQLYEAR